MLALLLQVARDRRRNTFDIIQDLILYEEDAAEQAVVVADPENQVTGHNSTTTCRTLINQNCPYYKGDVPGLSLCLISTESKLCEACARAGHYCASSLPAG